MGFGVNTGSTVAGFLGALSRLEYTMISDSVTLANKICGVAPAGTVLVSSTTRDFIKDQPDIEITPMERDVKGIGKMTLYQVNYRSKRDTDSTQGEKRDD